MRSSAVMELVFAFRRVASSRHTATRRKPQVLGMARRRAADSQSSPLPSQASSSLSSWGTMSTRKEVAHAATGGEVQEHFAVLEKVTSFGTQE